MKGDVKLTEDKIVRRRFGFQHAKPCAMPNVATCAQWACQVEDRCQFTRPAGRTVLGLAQAQEGGK